MHKNSNYITALPDFLTMQRVSFCWFITQGLTEEVALFSKIYDFGQNTEYILFSEEYTLIKPPYSVVIARKYNGNSRVQLVIPIEVRNKVLNEIQFQNQFPIITLPLMTTYATFIINGCERVIVSQIIRSPGIYFEKNKNQKTQKHLKRKVSSDIHKLRTFLPFGEAFISELDLFFGNYFWTLDIKKAEPKIIVKWSNSSIYYYSLQFLKNSKQQSSFYFFQCFKFYNLISSNVKLRSKEKLILLFLKWLKQKNTPIHIDLNSSIRNYLEYFKFLLKILIKYQIIEKNLPESPNLLELASFNKVSRLSNPQIRKLLQIYTKTIVNSQLTAQFQFHSKIVLVEENFANWQKEIENFLFLKKI